MATSRKKGSAMRRLLMTSALVLVAGLMVVPAALAQVEDEVTVQEGPPLTASPTPSANLEDDVILNTTTPTATVTVQEGPPLSASPTATVAAKDQYDGGGKKKEVVVGGGRTLPETGGVSSIALLAGALLIGGGVMS
jgi:hypothetical protein